MKQHLSGLQGNMVILGEHAFVIMFIECPPLQLQVSKLGEMFFERNHTPPNTLNAST